MEGRSITKTTDKLSINDIMLLIKTNKTNSSSNNLFNLLIALVDSNPTFEGTFHPTLPAALLDEYLKYAGIAWNSWFGIANSYVRRDDQTIRTDEVNAFKEHFFSSPTLLKLMLIFSEAQGYAERAKGETKTSQSDYADANVAVASYALRTILESKTLNSTFQSILQTFKTKYFQPLQDEVKNRHESHNQAELVKCLEALRLFLLKWNDQEIIDQAITNNRFNLTNESLPSDADAELLSKVNVKVDRNIPLIYQKYYYLYHILQTIQMDPKRSPNFIQLLKQGIKTKSGSKIMSPVANELKLITDVLEFGGPQVKETTSEEPEIEGEEKEQEELKETPKKETPLSRSSSTLFAAPPATEQTTAPPPSNPQKQYYMPAPKPNNRSEG